MQAAEPRQSSITSSRHIRLDSITTRDIGRPVFGQVDARKRQSGDQAQARFSQQVTIVGR